MLVRHMYSGLTLTGAIHFFLGTFCFVASMVGFKTKKWYGRRMFHPSYYYGISTEELPIVSAMFGCIASLWVISVGAFGILAGRKMSSPLLSHKLKITYMILNILSASVFAHTGIGAFTSLGVWIRYHHPTRLYILFSLAAFAMFVDFVLSIVSSSLLCCCSINEQSVWVSTDQGTEFLNPVSDMNVAPAISYPPNVVVEAYDPAQEKKRIEMEYS